MPPDALSMRTRVQNSGGPPVVTCEQASVKPYVELTGTPASRARCRSASGTGPPPVSAQRKAGGRSRPASSSRASVVDTRETSVTSCSRNARRTRSVSKRGWMMAVVA